MASLAGTQTTPPDSAVVPPTVVVAFEDDDIGPAGGGSERGRQSGRPRPHHHHRALCHHRAVTEYGVTNGRHHRERAHHAVATLSTGSIGLHSETPPSAATTWPVTQVIRNTETMASATPSAVPTPPREVRSATRAR
jgi:hypothetical protein